MCNSLHLESQSQPETIGCAIESFTLGNGWDWVPGKRTEASTRNPLLRCSASLLVFRAESPWRWAPSSRSEGPANRSREPCSFDRKKERTRVSHPNAGVQFKLGLWRLWMSYGCHDVTSFLELVADRWVSNSGTPNHFFVNFSDGPAFRWIREES